MSGKPRKRQKSEDQTKMDESEYDVDVECIKAHIPDHPPTNSPKKSSSFNKFLDRSCNIETKKRINGTVKEALDKGKNNPSLNFCACIFFIIGFIFLVLLLQFQEK